MAGPTFKLEEQLSDLRSNQIAYKLTIENPEKESMHLLSVEPRIPVGAKLMEVIASSLAQANARKDELVRELNELLEQYLFVVSDDFRQKWIEYSKKYLRELLSAKGMFKLYFELIFYFRSKQLQKFEKKFQSLTYKIASAADAKAAYERWMDKSFTHDIIKTLFKAKQEQLARIENRMDKSERPALTTIDSGSSFTATYVFKFKRKIFEPRKYQISFDATYLPPNSDSAQTNSTGISIRISPHPASLSLITIIGAVLGVLMGSFLRGTTELDFGVPTWLLKYTLPVWWQFVTGPILALIFFNVYEYTSLGKGIRMALSWRSALLVGAICGIAQAKVIAALKAIIGA